MIINKYVRIILNKKKKQTNRSILKDFFELVKIMLSPSKSIIKLKKKKKNDDQEDIYPLW